MASSGLRIDAIAELRFRDLEPIDKYNFYKITVYKKSSQNT